MSKVLSKDPLLQQSMKSTITLTLNKLHIRKVLSKDPSYSTCSVDQILTDFLLLIDMPYLHNIDIDVLALLLVLMIMITNICLLYTWMYCVLVPF